MRVCHSLGVLVFAVLPAAAQAQIAIYATSTNHRLSHVEDGSTYSATTNSYTIQYANFWASGIGAGFTYNFPTLGPVKLGLDFRGSLKPGTPGADTALIGFKIGGKAPLIKFKPYVQASGGYIATRATNVSTTPTHPQPAGGTFNERYWGYEILGGVDYPIPHAHILDFRLIEVGAGKGYNVGGLGLARPQVTLFTINSGVVLHF